MWYRDWEPNVAECGNRISTLPDPDPASRDEACRLLDSYLAEVAASLQQRRQAIQLANPFLEADSIAASDLESGRAILEADVPVQVAVIRDSLDRGLPNEQGLADTLECYYESRRIAELTTSLLRRNLAYMPEDVTWLIERIARSEADWRLLEFCPVSIQALLRSIERWTRKHSLPAGAIASLATIRSNIQATYYDSGGVRALALIAELVGEDDNRLVDPDDDWGQEVTNTLSRVPSDPKAAYLAILAHAGSIRGTRPTKTWQQEMITHMNRIGESEFREALTELLALLERPTRGTQYRRADGLEYPSRYTAERNTDLLKGLAWAASLTSDEAMAMALGDAALACYRKIPNYGARSTKAGNACVQALGAMASLTSIAQLQRLLQRAKLPSQTSQIEGALAAAAHTRGLSAEELEEMVVPTFGFVNGIATRAFGEFTAELTVRGSDTVDLNWLKADGTSQKSVPWQVKSDYPDRLKELKREQKEIREALAVQRSRIERLMVDDRNWSFPDWRGRYLDHPLVSLIASRLLWTFEQDELSMVGGCVDGQIVGLDGSKLDWLGDATRVRIWHPIESPADEVLAWREWLECHEITQPFKQAHREIYILTDAERETGTYSNRFAAHILRQHRLNTLCQQRGWRYRLQGAWDGFNVPTLEFPELGLQAEYWVEGIEQGDGGGLSSAYINLYAATDQVRFADSSSGAAIPLAEIPPRLFSEVMRDVDLFVGVSSIGADPHWLDGGQVCMDGYQGYWWDFSLGELTVRAESRRESLARLLPRMSKLDGRWELDGRFLKIRGAIRSYKIHLGSGNILMEPNDQYLCIVPGRGARGRRPGDDLFLPFEGDQTLSVILSNALMLAEDANIKDPTIKMQVSPSAS